MNIQRIPASHLNKRKLISKGYATFNKSILSTKLNNPNLYRYFCLSLYRSNYYNVRMRLKDLAKFTGEKEGAVQNFNKAINGIVTIKDYYLPTNHPIYTTRRHSYHLPDIEEEFITISETLTKAKVPVKIKGYYIKLLLIAEDNIISLSNSQISELLMMSESTVATYNLELHIIGLLELQNKGIKLTPNGILLDNDLAAPKLIWNEATTNPLPNIILKSNT